METISYTDKVYKLLIEMQGEIIISDKVAPANLDKFIAIVKEFIRFDNGKVYNFMIEFSSDYTKIRKLHK